MLIEHLKLALKSDIRLQKAIPLIDFFASPPPPKIIDVLGILPRKTRKTQEKIRRNSGIGRGKWKLVGNALLSVNGKVLF